MSTIFIPGSFYKISKSYKMDNLKRIKVATRDSWIYVKNFRGAVVLVWCITKIKQTLKNWPVYWGISFVCLSTTGLYFVSSQIWEWALKTNLLSKSLFYLLNHWDRWWLGIHGGTGRDTDTWISQTHKFMGNQIHGLQHPFSDSYWNCPLVMFRVLSEHRGHHAPPP